MKLGYPIFLISSFMDFLSQTENKKLLSEFIEEVNHIRFVLMVSVGCEQIDKILWHWLLKDFDDWMLSLRRGELDDREWIFNDGSKNLEKFINAVKGRRMPPFPLRNRSRSLRRLKLTTN